MFFFGSFALSPESTEVLSISGRFVPDEVAHASFDKAPRDWSRAGLLAMDDTVDGWNPANQFIGSLSHYLRRVSKTSQVVQDFSHQQYHERLEHLDQQSKFRTDIDIYIFNI